MSVATELQAILASAMAEFPQSAVAVIIGAASGSAMRSDELSDADLMLIGEDGKDAARIRASVATFPNVARGQIITVAGTQCKVESARQDPNHALWSILYQAL